MNNIQIFKNSSFGEVRVTMSENNEPLFCLVDVCNALGIANHRDVKSRLNAKGVVTTDTLTKGGLQPMVYIDEGNLYKTTFQSRKPEAEVFQDWLCYEVAPSIRKHGAYLSNEAIEKALTDPDTIIQLATNLKIERQKRLEAETTVKKLEPKAEFADRVLYFDDKIDIGQAAKILNLGFGRNTLYQKLRENGTFFKNRNEPKQEFVDRGYFEVKEKLISRDNNPNFVVVVVLVTQKGLKFLSEMFDGKPTQRKLALIG